jgi:selenocysteine lyase/cysteine desulfurase
MNVQNRNDYGARDMTLRSDAGRYECGTLNTIGCFGLRASIEMLLGIGVERIGPVVQSLSDRLAEGALRKDYQLLGNRSPQSSSGIVSIQKPGVDGGKIMRELRDKKILAAPRQGWIRFSPHFYISPDDIDQVIDALPDA